MAKLGYWLSQLGTVQSPCPEGFVCAKGLCVHPGDLDAPVSEDGPSTADVAPFDEAPLDGPTETSSQVDVANVVGAGIDGAPDRVVADKPGDAFGGSDGGVP
jgi:hypothetical protein